MQPFDDNTKTLIDLALREDLNFPWHDATCHTVFSDQSFGLEVEIISKHVESAVICGLPLVHYVYQQLSADCIVETSYKDGDSLAFGDRLLSVQGPAQALLMGERVVLNFLRHLCAVATLTAKFVALVSESGLQILDTRKTTPGFRALEKYAVQCGGGVNHRQGLYDAIMIKDTHVDLIGGMQTALAQLPDLSLQTLPVIVEVRSLDELQTVLAYGLNKINRVLLDNMSLTDLRTSVQLCQQAGVSTEASGNINLETVKAIADTGVEYASVGMLTHSTASVDLSMKALT